MSWPRTKSGCESRLVREGHGVAESGVAEEEPQFRRGVYGSALSEKADFSASVFVRFVFVRFVAR
jgi:hypothetical protein